MVARLLSLIVVGMLLAVPVRADVTPQTQALLNAMKIRDLIEIMREEGLAYSDELEDELFAGRGGAGWRLVVGSIYAADDMYQRFSSVFARELGDEDAEVLTDFFTSERGQRVVDLELEARRAFLDPSLEEAAIEVYREARSEQEEFLEALDQFVEVNDLIESNVMGALNSNYAFYKGLNESNAFPRRMSEGEILADVWSQEEAIRSDSEEWVYSYLTLAYKPLEASDLEVYTALSESPSGKTLNTALFAAFDAVFTKVSYDLGAAAARFIAGQDL